MFAIQIGGVGHIGHFALTVHQHKHFVQISQALFDFAVQHTQEIQRDVKLNHEGVDHDQVAQGHAPFHHALRGAPQHGHQSRCNDELLACVEQGQGGLRLQSCFAQSLQTFVIPAGFISFIAKVLHGFIVQQ